MVHTKAVLGFALALVLWIAVSALAQLQPPESKTDDVRKEMDALRQQMEAQKKEYDARLTEMQRKLDARGSSAAIGGAASVSSDASSKEEDLRAVIDRLKGERTDRQPPALLQQAAQTYQSLNPDMSVIGDFLGHYDSRGSRPDFGTGFLLREIELAFSAHVDPYARADIFASIAEDPRTHEFNADIEEAYLTLLTLPWDLQARVGRFKASFGKANSLHLHALPWVEEPLVVRRMFGEEGLSGDGISLSRLVPNPWEHYIEATFEVMNNDNGSMFAGEQSHDFVAVAHLKDVVTLSPASTVEVGVSFATGPNDAAHGGSRSWVEGFDVTYKWRPQKEGLYKSFTWMNEVFTAQKDTPGGRQNSWGMYSAPEYQFAQRWSLGTRYDFSERPDDGGDREHAGSVYLTFRQSEFCYWRLGYQHSERNFEEFGSRRDDQVWLQLNFSLGAHGAHKY